MYKLDKMIARIKDTQSQQQMWLMKNLNVGQMLKDIFVNVI